MRGLRQRVVAAAGFAGLGLLLLAVFSLPAQGAETPRYGGVMNFVVPAEPPSFDAHREDTFALVHPLAPFYSLLIKVNPDNPSDPNDLVPDVAEALPAVSGDGKTYTFKVRRGVRWHDGSPLTARDVKATFDKMVFPPKGVPSVRKAQFSVVESIEAPDDSTVVFRLKHPTAAFLPAVAGPFNFIYKADNLKKDMHWYEKNILGTGPFKFKERVAGSHIEGVKNPDYFVKGRPYLDGFRAIFARAESARVAAIRGGRALIEFRGFPPKARDDLVRALGNKVQVQESDWNCALYIAMNHKKKPFDDPRVRRALTLALDRWGGSKGLSQIAIVKTVGGVVFPGHPLAATKEELQTLAGYWPDIEKSRAEARRLLREAGVPEGFTFEFHNRGIDQPYKHIAIWAIDQWRKVGLNATHKVQETTAFYKDLRGGGYQVTMDFNCQSIVNPTLDVAKFISDDRSDGNWGKYQDRVLDDLFDRQAREPDPKKQRELLRQYEKRLLDDQVHYLMTLWWYRIIPHSARLRGWKISPSHYLNQDLANVWLAPE